MKLIKPSFELIESNDYSIKGVYKSIELAGRVSYKSEDKITEDSAEEFVNRMISLGHNAVLEFGTIYLAITNPFLIVDLREFFLHNHYSKVYKNTLESGWRESCLYVTTNYRVLVENFSKDMVSKILEYLCRPTEYHEKRICVKFTCDRGVSHEFVRHRAFSFMQESTRWCNYSKDKFNNELTFIIPCWMDIPEGSIGLGNYDKTSARYEDGNTYIIDDEPPYVGVDFIRSLFESEATYLSIVRNGWTPQQARSVLPNALKTELFMCGFEEDWKHFFDLRCANNAHPQARELAIPLKDKLDLR